MIDRKQCLIVFTLLRHSPVMINRHQPIFPLSSSSRWWLQAHPPPPRVTLTERPDSKRRQTFQAPRPGEKHFQKRPTLRSLLYDYRVSANENKKPHGSAVQQLIEYGDFQAGYPRLTCLLGRPVGRCGFPIEVDENWLRFVFLSQLPSGRDSHFAQELGPTHAWAQSLGHEAMECPKHVVFDLDLKGPSFLDIASVQANGVSILNVIWRTVVTLLHLTSLSDRQCAVTSACGRVTPTSVKSSYSLIFGVVLPLHRHLPLRQRVVQALHSTFGPSIMDIDVEKVVDENLCNVGAGNRCLGHDKYIQPVPTECRPKCRHRSERRRRCACRYRRQGRPQVPFAFIDHHGHLLPSVSWSSFTLACRITPTRSVLTSTSPRTTDSMLSSVEEVMPFVPLRLPLSIAMDPKLTSMPDSDTSLIKYDSLIQRRAKRLRQSQARRLSSSPSLSSGGQLKWPVDLSEPIVDTIMSWIIQDGRLGPDAVIQKVWVTRFRRAKRIDYVPSCSSTTVSIPDDPPSDEDWSYKLVCVFKSKSCYCLNDGSVVESKKKPFPHIHSSQSTDVSFSVHPPFVQASSWIDDWHCRSELSLLRKRVLLGYGDVRSGDRLNVDPSQLSVVVDFLVDRFIDDTGPSPPRTKKIKI